MSKLDLRKDSLDIPYQIYSPANRNANRTQISSYTNSKHDRSGSLHKRKSNPNMDIADIIDTQQSFNPQQNNRSIKRQNSVKLNHDVSVEVDAKTITPEGTPDKPKLIKFSSTIRSSLPLSRDSSRPLSVMRKEAQDIKPIVVIDDSKRQQQPPLALNQISTISLLKQLIDKPSRNNVVMNINSRKSGTPNKKIMKLKDRKRSESGQLELKPTTPPRVLIQHYPLGSRQDTSVLNSQESARPKNKRRKVLKSKLTSNQISLKNNDFDFEFEPLQIKQFKLPHLKEAPQRFNSEIADKYYQLNSNQNLSRSPPKNSNQGTISQASLMFDDSKDMVKHGKVRSPINMSTYMSKQSSKKTLFLPSHQISASKLSNGSLAGSNQQDFEHPQPKILPKIQVKNVFTENSLEELQLGSQKLNSESDEERTYLNLTSNRSFLKKNLTQPLRVILSREGSVQDYKHKPQKKSKIVTPITERSNVIGSNIKPLVKREKGSLMNVKSLSSTHRFLQKNNKVMKQQTRVMRNYSQNLQKFYNKDEWNKKPESYGQLNHSPSSLLDLNRNDIAKMNIMSKNFLTHMNLQSTQVKKMVHANQILEKLKTKDKFYLGVELDQRQ